MVFPRRPAPERPRVGRKPREAPSAPRRLDFDLVPVLTPAGVETALLVETAIGVGAEIVAQALQQVRWTPRAPQPVVIGQRRRESRRRHAVGDRKAKHPPPRALRPRDALAEVVIEQEVRE